MVESLLGLLFILGFPLWLAAEEIVTALHVDDADPHEPLRPVSQETR